MARATVSPPTPESKTPMGAFLFIQRLVNLFARGAHRELLWIASRSPHLATQSDDGGPGYGRLEDFFLLNKVRETLMIALVEGGELLLPLENGATANVTPLVVVC